jgi:hypothetical protein
VKKLFAVDVARGRVLLETLDDVERDLRKVDVLAADDLRAFAETAELGDIFSSIYGFVVLVRVSDAQMDAMRDMWGTAWEVAPWS